jgi:hypothetical protein
MSIMAALATDEPVSSSTETATVPPTAKDAASGDREILDELARNRDLDS